jgi:hypothetical protein
MTDNKNKACDLAKSKYEEIIKTLTLLEQQIFSEYLSGGTIEEEDIGLVCIKGYN